MGRKLKRYCKSCITMKYLESFDGSSEMCVCCDGSPSTEKDIPKIRECLGSNCESKTLEQRMFLSKSKFNKMCGQCKDSDFARFHA